MFGDRWNVFVCVVVCVTLSIISEHVAYCGRLGEQLLRIVVAALERLAEQRIGVGSMLTGVPVSGNRVTRAIAFVRQIAAVVATVIVAVVAAGFA